MRNRLIAAAALLAVSLTALATVTHTEPAHELEVRIAAPAWAAPAPTDPIPTTSTTTTTTTEPPPAPAPTPPPSSSSSAPSTVDVGAFLACVRNRESGGDYTVHEATGASNAAGAYQFLGSTWNATAAHAGRPDLIGRDPATVSPADQDAMALALYEWQGTAPWGGHCP